MCCPHFHTSLLSKGAPNDLLLTPAPLSFPCFVDRALNPPGDQRESLRAPCDDQRVLEGSWQPIICLLVASCLASHFSRVPFLIFLPGELFYVWNGLVVFLRNSILQKVTLIDPHCVYLEKTTALLCFQPCMYTQVYKSVHPISKISVD